MKCKDCKYYKPECLYEKGDSPRWKKWGDCKHPKLDFTFGDTVSAGADDDYGSYWRMAKDFGCIFFQEK